MSSAVVSVDAPPYRPVHHVRVVTAASLFDGHDAAINVMRRLLQAAGAEVIHLGHNRSASEIVDCAIQESAQAVAITSYQGGHLEFFKYIVDLLRAKHAPIKVFGGGGGTILPNEIEELQRYGVTRLYSPDDGRALGLQGMIGDLLRQCDFPAVTALPARLIERLEQRDSQAVATLITAHESHPELVEPFRAELAQRASASSAPVLGVTGTGGAGKSSLVDELLVRFLADSEHETAAVLCVDPTKRRSGGALLGDRIRMNALDDPRLYTRSFATRRGSASLAREIGAAIQVCKAAGFDLIIVETSGIGQSDSEITDISDLSLYVMTSEYGAASQLEKIDMLDFADFVAVNKSDKPGSLDALRDVRRQYRRSRPGLLASDAELPIVGTVAAQFADPGVDELYRRIAARLVGQVAKFRPRDRGIQGTTAERQPAIAPARSRYLAEIAEGCRQYDAWAEAASARAREVWQLRGAAELVGADSGTKAALERRADALWSSLDPSCRALLERWPETKARYASDDYAYEVRGKLIRQALSSESLSHTRIPKVSLPRFHDWGEILRFLLTEGPPGEFPFTAGVFPLKREGEAPARMFAGEGGPERTNRRFHYVSRGSPAKRLSTAFDSVTLYGEEPGKRPDVYGKVGNSGVSVATLDDAKKLYSGFDLCDSRTSVSMTINGPAPMLLAMFLNAAVDQACEKWIRGQGKAEDVERRVSELYAARDLPRPRYDGTLPDGNDGLGLLLLGVTGDEILPGEEYERVREHALRDVRGTVQADILKEDQAQNTCIFSVDFALRMMADIQAYFVQHEIRNFYSVSISGYHIAEAGANPITQLAFTLANGFTYIEHYLSRGMRVDDFAPNFSFFFSNGLDPEYSVLGRVARRIWAKTLKLRYGAAERSQKLKYHVQTSGRSLHAQEIAFNDVRTTLQALYALQDNCNSLHTNAYDEAITTPTEESVRRALAIQLIINEELGTSRNENPLQGSFFIEQLTDEVERAVLDEFDRLSARGGVLGAMERMYQRSKIQEESLHYETLKHDGRLPLIGVNTFVGPKATSGVLPPEVIRATPDEKEAVLRSLAQFHRYHAGRAADALIRLQEAAVTDTSTFSALMDAVKVCSLGQLSRALYRAGGRYRRNM